MRVVALDQNQFIQTPFRHDLNDGVELVTKLQLETLRQSRLWQWIAKGCSECGSLSLPSALFCDTCGAKFNKKVEIKETIEETDEEETEENKEIVEKKETVVEEKRRVVKILRRPVEVVEGGQKKKKNSEKLKIPRDICWDWRKGHCAKSKCYRNHDPAYLGIKKE